MRDTRSAFYQLTRNEQDSRSRPLVGSLFFSRVELTGAADIGTALGAVTTLFGTFIGFYFGHQAGSSGKERAEDSHRRSEAVASAALAHVDPTEREKVMGHVQPTLRSNTESSPSTQHPLGENYRNLSA